MAQSNNRRLRASRNVRYMAPEIEEPPQNPQIPEWTFDDVMKHRLATGSIPVSILQNDRLEPYGALSDSVERRLKRTDICRKAAQRFGIEVHNGVYTLNSKYYGTLALDSYPYESKDIRDKAKAKAMEWECLNGGTRKPKRTSGSVAFNATEKPEKRPRVEANQVERVGPLLIFSGLGIRDFLKTIKTRTTGLDGTAHTALELAARMPPVPSQPISHQPENAHTKDSPPTKVHHNQEEYRQNDTVGHPIILPHDSRSESQYLSAQARSSSHSCLEGLQISYASNMPHLKEKEMVRQYEPRLRALVNDDVNLTIDGESARRYRNGESSRMNKQTDKGYVSETKSEDKQHAVKTEEARVFQSRKKITTGARTYKTESTQAKTPNTSRFPTNVPEVDLDIARRHKDLLEEIQKLKEEHDTERREAEAERKRLQEENRKLQAKLKLKNQRIKALMESNDEEEE